MTVHLSYILATVSRKDFRGYCPRGWGALLGAKGQEALADGCPWRQARSCETSLLKCGQASATQLRPRGRTAICAKSRTTWHIAAAAILNMVHQYSRPETFPRIPHIPRGRTLATANRGMRGMGGRYRRIRPGFVGFVQCQENQSGTAISRWNASFRPTNESRCVGVTAGGYYNRCSSSCCRRSR